VLPTWEEPDPTFAERRVVDRLLEQRIIHLGGHLDTAMGNRATAQLLLLAARGSGPIELHLSCPESDLDASLALADSVDLVAAPVHITVHGMLVGPAIAVLCAGQERGAHRNALLVVSLPPASAQGTAHELRVRAEQHERQVAQLRDLIAGTTDRPIDEVEADLRAGRVLSADEALDLGLLNRLI
jgi:ATP-dependent Clp protease protease subunit